MFEHLLRFVGMAVIGVMTVNASAFGACAEDYYPVTYFTEPYYSPVNTCAPCHTRPSQTYYVGDYARCGPNGLTCQSPNEMHLIEDGWNNDANAFYYHNVCRCTAADTYVGYNNKCFDCPDNRYNDYTCSNDGAGNTTFECNKIYEYKVAYTQSSSGGNYGKYTCVRCPEIQNCSDFDVGGYHESCLYSGTERGILIWEEQTEPAKRCNGTRNGTLTDWFESNRKKCEYTITDIKPESGCTWYNNTDAIPSYESLVYVSGGCNYTFKKNYSSASAGYGVTNNNTQNATCGPCPAGTYSTESDITCKSPPENATVNDTRDDFLCNVGYFRNGNACTPCPADMEYGGKTPTTAGIGALSASECYISGADISEESDTTGSFQRIGICPYGGAFSGYYTLCIETPNGVNDSCENAVRNYWSSYEHLTNSSSNYGALDNAVEMTMHSQSVIPNGETCESKNRDWFQYDDSTVALHTDDVNRAAAWLQYLTPCTPKVLTDVYW
ncbi:MAG: hypothetical protein J5679_00970 [Alphaproteobacteria bacterium]|nr:hypothetical protein [Alphaproteobacteria bacterium]